MLMRGRTLGLALGLVALLTSTRSFAGLSEEEYARLVRGEIVARPRLVDVGASRYVGGVSYVIVGASADLVQKLIRDPRNYANLVPKLKRATLVGENDGDRYYHILHSLFGVSYTVHLHDAPRELQFWVDQQKAHDVEDAWGYVHSEPFNDLQAAPANVSYAPTGKTGCGERSIVTYGMMIRLGPGIVRELFSEKLRAAALSLPRRLQKLTDQVCQSGPH